MPGHNSVRVLGFVVSGYFPPLFLSIFLESLASCLLHFPLLSLCPDLHFYTLFGLLQNAKRQRLQQFCSPFSVLGFIAAHFPRFSFLFPLSLFCIEKFGLVQNVGRQTLFLSLGQGKLATVSA